MDSHSANMNQIPAAAPAHPAEDLTFRPSAGTSLGVELELQILDRESGDLAPGAVRLLQACREEGIANASAELLQSMIEVKTGICQNVQEVQESLLPALRRVRNLAASLGYDLAMGGTHPFNRTSSSTVFPAERYQRVQDRMAWLAYQIVVFGLHVHVGMADGDLAIGTINLLVQYLPHLLALSANSPFWQGVDTGLASTRSALFRLTPHAALPHYFPGWKEFRTYVDVMRACEAIQNTKDIYWDIRPRPQTGTIEFRICDMPASLAHVLGLAALIRCLVIASQRLLQEKPRLRRGDLRRYWIAVENKWLASRYGLQAQCIRSPGGKRQPLARDLEELFERLLPIARETGDAPFLAALQPLDRFESGADRQRRLYRDSGKWKDVLDDMRSRLAQELDGASTLSHAPAGARPEDAAAGNRQAKE
ncbi:MAG TPA: YbdK family carboxylate-amine ligase [Gemmataceae bacterium]|nr:YbdK family carboxylate-amine ligase [Gemmataceae bacterium]